MSEPQKTTASFARWSALALDLLITLALLVYVSGGLRLGEKLYLSHAAEPRRAMVLLLALVCLVPSLRAHSFSARALLRFAFSLVESVRARWLFVMGVAIVAAWVGALQMLALRYPVFDVGIFHQLGWSLKEGLGFHSPLSGAGDFLKDHLALSLVALVPLYAAFDSSPLILPLLHPFLIFGGVLAWIRLASIESSSSGGAKWIVGAVLALSLTWDSLWANLRWGFHENSIAFFAFSWALALARGSRLEWRLSYLLLVIACLSKETLLLTGALAGGLWPLLLRQKGPHLQPLGRIWALSFVWACIMLLGFVLFQMKEHAPDKNYFVRYYSYLGTSLSEVFLNLLTEPWRVWEAIGSTEIFRFIWVLFSPFLFAPAVSFFLQSGSVSSSSRRASIACFLMPLPSIASQLLSTYAPLRNPGLHYVLEIWPFWMAASIFVWSGLWASQGARSWLKRWLIAAVILMAFRMVQDPLSGIREYGSQATLAKAFRQEMSALDRSASIAVDDGIGAWVSARAHVVRWPEGVRFLEGSCPDYFVVSKNTELGDCQSRVSEVSSFEGWRILRLLPQP